MADLNKVLLIGSVSKGPVQHFRDTNALFSMTVDDGDVDVIVSPEAGANGCKDKLFEGRRVYIEGKLISKTVYATAVTYLQSQKAP